jgi:hypothetical protein
MTDVRFQQYLARFQESSLSRRTLIRSTAAAAVAVPAAAALGTHRVAAAPLAAPRRQIDARTLVIADDLRRGSTKLMRPPVTISTMSSSMDFRIQTNQMSSPRYSRLTFP